MDDRKRKAPAGPEPQSYGSQQDWVRGETGQSVNDTQNSARRHDEEFYDDHRETEESRSPRGGLTSPLQREDPLQAAGVDSASAEVVGTPIQKISERSDERHSYWKDRDYS